jgi:hypothetical protein
MPTDTCYIHSEPEQLIITQRRFMGASIFGVFGMILGVLTYYLPKIFSVKDLTNTTYVPLVIVNLLGIVFYGAVVVAALWGLKITFCPEVLRFDRRANTLFRNDKPLCPLDQINGVHAKLWLWLPATRYQTRSQRAYRLWLCLKDGGLLALNRNLADELRIDEVGRAVAEFLKVPYTPLSS